MNKSKRQRRQSTSRAEARESLEATNEQLGSIQPQARLKPAWLLDGQISEESTRMVEEVFAKNSIPPALRELFAAIYVALDADQRALAASASMSSVTVDRVALREDLLYVPVRLLREARDNILLATPDSYVPVVQFRMERFIKATAERLDALLEYRPLLSRTAEDLLVSTDVAREAIDSLEDAVQLWKFLKPRREPEGEALEEQLRRISDSIASLRDGTSLQLELPVLIADAAKAANMRPDDLLEKLRRKKYAIIGKPRHFTASLSQILLCVHPAKRKQLKKWAGVLGEDC